MVVGPPRSRRLQNAGRLRRSRMGPRAPPERRQPPHRGDSILPCAALSCAGPGRPRRAWPPANATRSERASRRVTPSTRRFQAARCFSTSSSRWLNSSSRCSSALCLGLDARALAIASNWAWAEARSASNASLRPSTRRSSLSDSFAADGRLRGASASRASRATMSARPRGLRPRVRSRPRIGPRPPRRPRASRRCPRLARTARRRPPAPSAVARTESAASDCSCSCKESAQSSPGVLDVRAKHRHLVLGPCDLARGRCRRGRDRVETLDDAIDLGARFREVLVGDARGVLAGLLQRDGPRRECGEFLPLLAEERAQTCIGVLEGGAEGRQLPSVPETLLAVDVSEVASESSRPDKAPTVPSSSSKRCSSPAETALEARSCSSAVVSTRDTSSVSDPVRSVSRRGAR